MCNLLKSVNDGAVCNQLTEKIKLHIHEKLINLQQQIIQKEYQIRLLKMPRLNNAIRNNVHYDVLKQKNMIVTKQGIITYGDGTVLGNSFSEYIDGKIKVIKNIKRNEKIISPKSAYIDECRDFILTNCGLCREDLYNLYKQNQRNEFENTILERFSIDVEPLKLEFNSNLEMYSLC